MSANSETCIICEQSPCECKKANSKKRAPRVSSPTRAPQSEPRPAIHRRVIGRGTSVDAEQTPQQVEQPAEEEPDLQSDDPDFIYAVRLLAHMVRPEDLAPFSDDILPSDRKPPEDRIADWKRRVGGS